MENLSRDEWIARTFHAFVYRGVDARRVEPLARRLGVTVPQFRWRSSGGPAMSAREIGEAVDQPIADAP